MFKNYLKVAWRSFIGQKYYSAINTLGLALGIAACILILLFVQEELSYESGFKNDGKIYRLVQDFPMGDHLSTSATVPFPTKGTLLNDFPEISQAAFIFRPSSWGNNSLIQIGDKEYFEDDFVFAESSLFDIYDFNFIYGQAENVLVNSNEIILTQSIAEKYFGVENPLGKNVSLGGFRDMEVIAVIEDLPENTHLQFDLIGSFETYKSFFNNPQFFDNGWVWVAAWLYMQIDDPAEAEKIRQQLPAFVKNHYPEVLSDKGVVLHLQEANDIHLTSSRELEFKANGNIRHVYLFSIIAVLILIIAIINFMNLATSRSTKRAKEVGLRKVVGSQKRMLVAQFIGESILTSLLSLVVAIMLIYLMLPWFNAISGKNIYFDLVSNPSLILGMLILGLLVGLLAGSYPALILSSFKPVDVRKGDRGSTGASQFLRKALVVVQFVVSITLIICIGIVHKQLNYIENKDLGFSQEQILTADVDFRQFSKLPAFANELERNPEIIAISMIGGSIPGEEALVENAFVAEGETDEDQQFFSAMFVQYDFEKIIDLDFLQGHAFMPGSSVDSTGYIINESAARALGYQGDVIGRTIRMPNNNANGEIIGLVKDFNYRPLYEPIKPLIIRLGGGKLMVKMKSEDLPGAIAKVDDLWKAQFGEFPFRYSFMDDNFDLLYTKENRFSKTIQYFSILAVFIACLGLLGLSSYATERRRKEIGIRKVNGASTFSLVFLLSTNFSRLVFIAFLISIPVAYYFGELWLNNFAYRITIGPDLFIIAGLLAFVLALLTVSFHTFRAARSNPVEAIRYE